jgi:glyoxylase-like metal-dependent hydrolase (beta-lactamase superfamily II)
MDERIIVGNVDITCVTDAQGVFPIKIGQLYPGVTPEQWLPYRRDFPETFVDAETWRAHYGCYVLRSRSSVVLVDTGIGPTPAPLFGDARGDLIHQLSLVDVKVRDIDTVFITHLHPDHVGWNLTGGKPTFPEARYVVSETDWKAFQTPEVQKIFPFSYVDEMITPLENSGRLQLIDGETALTEEIVALPAPGHTPGHMAVVVSSGGQQAMILGDAMGHPAQVSEPEWAFAFDMDPEQAIATRKKLLGKLELQAMTGAQCHFPPPGFGLVVRTEGRRHWQPLDRPD